MSKLAIQMTDPFTVFTFSQLFEDNEIAEMQRGFPNIEDFPHFDLASKKYFMDHTQSDTWAFVNRSSIWKSVISKIQSHAFLCDLIVGLHDTPECQFLRNFKTPVATSTPGKFIARRERFGRSISLKIGFEFSCLVDGSELRPHTDSASKLLSVLTYLPAIDENKPPSHSEMGTVFYRPRRPEYRLENWESRPLSHYELNQFYEKHEIVYQSDFNPSISIGFCKSSVSWHGVPNLKLSPNTRRNSFNVVVFTSLRDVRNRSS